MVGIVAILNPSLELYLGRIMAPKARSSGELVEDLRTIDRAKNKQSRKNFRISDTFTDLSVFNES